jgi:hypothetical protein
MEIPLEEEPTVATAVAIGNRSFDERMSVTAGG